MTGGRIKKVQFFFNTSIFLLPVHPVIKRRAAQATCDSKDEFSMLG